MGDHELAALRDLERTVQKMREDGFPYGETGGDDWYAILHERLLAVEVARDWDSDPVKAFQDHGLPCWHGTYGGCVECETP